MFGIRKKKVSQNITLMKGTDVLYSGPVSEIPLTDEQILAACMKFFNDPEPCYIHKGASRLRLVAEITQTLQTENPDIKKIQDYTGLALDRAVLES